ncbi:MAG: hypothetical protein AAF724_17280 [Pseudomonadota bacterium]
MQDSSDLGRLVRRMRQPANEPTSGPGNGPANGNVIAFKTADAERPLSAEEALVTWMLDLPDSAAIETAARYALRHLAHGLNRSPEVERFCRYLRQAEACAAEEAKPRRHGRRGRRS